MMKDSKQESENYMSMATMEQPEAEVKIQKKSKPSYSVQDKELFIKENLPEIDRPITKLTMSNVTPSYWRVNVWGRKKDSTIPFGDNEIIMSKFIRIDVDKDGNMIYNDVTDGKEI